MAAELRGVIVQGERDLEIRGSAAAAAEGRADTSHPVPVLGAAALWGPSARTNDDENQAKHHEIVFRLLHMNENNKNERNNMGVI